MTGKRLRALIGPVAAALAVAAHGGTARAAGCTTRPGGVGSTGSASQLIVVRGAGASTYGTLSLWQRKNGCWVAAGGPWTARVGRNGLSAHHREGDGTTPEGSFGLEPVFYGTAPNPGVRYRYHRLVCGDWWDEDSSSPAYNRFEHVPCGIRPPFGGGSEALWQETTAYTSFAALTYNVDPAVPGRGSAIFLHADTGSATNGCVSLPRSELNRVLRWLDPKLKPLVVIE
ncbi:MAG TPA: L,D-transpeptidase family protein [Gaiellaceae bacterium]|nr:L,D-transpeptidase family protein [Gaiellaceae bacterium]